MAERTSAAALTTIAVIKMGDQATDELYAQVLSAMEPIVTSHDDSDAGRIACIESLAMCCLHACSDLDAVNSLLSMLASVAERGSEAARVACISARTLLMTHHLLLAGDIRAAFATHLNSMLRLLAMSNVDLRVAAGENLALMYERVRGTMSMDEFHHWLEDEHLTELHEQVCEQLRTLAREHTKRQSRRDLRRQHAMLRDILASVECGTCPEEVLKLTGEQCCFTQWSLLRRVDALRAVFGSGFKLQAELDPSVRMLLDMSEPLLPQARRMTPTSFEKHRQLLAMAGAAKARTRDRQSCRDQRAAALAW